MGIGHSAFCQKIKEITGSGTGSEYSYKEGTILDLMCGTSCAGFGYSSNIQQRILNRAKKAPLNTYDYPTIWREEAKKALETLHPHYEFAFFNGGAEAVEAAIKIARSLEKQNRKKVAGFEKCFHGKTFLTGMLTNEIESEYTTILPYRIPIKIPDDVFAVVVEPFQCRNGVFTPSLDFFNELISKAASKNVFIINDEISTSLRSGHAITLDRFVENYSPPIICLGKNYGQGIPVSLVGVRKDLSPKVKVSLTSGYGGNPLACIAIAETIKEVNNSNLLNVIRSNENEFLTKLATLANLPAVKEVRGFGFWFGVEFHDKNFAAEVAEELLHYGYIVGSVPPNIRLAPSFDIGKNAWETFINVLRSIIQSESEC